MELVVLVMVVVEVEVGGGEGGGRGVSGGGDSWKIISFNLFFLDNSNTVK